MNKLFQNKLIVSISLLMFSVGGVFLPAGFAFAQSYNYPALSISVYADKSYIQSTSAEIITYTINYQNYGNVRANNVVVTNDYNENYLTIYDANNGTVSGGTLYWNIGTLDPGQSGTRSFRAQIKTGLGYGTTYINDTATIDSDETNLVTSNTATIQYVNNNQYYGVPSVDLKVNGSDSNVSVPYNTPVVLTWTSSNVNYCYASGDWSGNKSLSGTENLGYITSSKTYTITCTGSSGTAADTIYVTATPYYNPAPAPTPCYGSSCSYSSPTIEKTGMNLSTGNSSLSHVIVATPGNIIMFQLKVTGTGNSNSVIIKDALPEKSIYLGKLTLDGTTISGDIVSGVNIGYLSAGQTRTITFQAQVSATGFTAGQQIKLNNVATVYAGSYQDSDTASVCVGVKKVVIKPTYISTGITDNIFIDSFIIPLIISLLILWLFKSRIAGIQQWRDLARERYEDYKTKKLFNSKIAKIREKEFN
jgi:hypothetical protein